MYKRQHADWSIDAPANGGMVKINMTVNYNFLPDRVVDVYKQFNGMSGETIVESRVQNSIIAYVKEVTPQFTVMDIYSDKKSEVNEAITTYLNERLTEAVSYTHLDVYKRQVYTNTHFFYKNHTKTSIISTLARV